MTQFFQIQPLLKVGQSVPARLIAANPVFVRSNQVKPKPWSCRAFPPVIGSGFMVKPGKTKMPAREPAVLPPMVRASNTFARRFPAAQRKGRPGRPKRRRYDPEIMHDAPCDLQFHISPVKRFKAVFSWHR